jgi:hypothetical protein
MLSEVFYTFVISSSVALIAKIATLCFKSKCKEVTLCCLKVIRDTEAEEKEQEFMTLHKGDQSPSPTNSDDESKKTNSDKTNV